MDMQSLSGSVQVEQICICSSKLGQGEETLGALLMKNFLYTLARQEELNLRCISLINSGVSLACEGSESIEDLQLLARRGVHIQACGTCLDFYQLKDKLIVGQVGTMQSIVFACTHNSSISLG